MPIKQEIYLAELKITRDAWGVITAHATDRQRIIDTDTNQLIAPEHTLPPRRVNPGDAEALVGGSMGILTQIESLQTALLNAEARNLDLGTQIAALEVQVAALTPEPNPEPIEPETPA